MDILNEYFEVKGEDVYYTFRGKIGAKIKGGKKNPLYGKRVNLSDVYEMMIKDISEYMDSEEFLVTMRQVGKFKLVYEILKVITDKYGVTFEWVYNKINDCSCNITTDVLFEEVIRYKGGVDKVDWMAMYVNMSQFYTNNECILMCIAKSILKGEIYAYFVDRYNLRVKEVTKMKDNRMYIVLNWDGKDDVTIERLILLGHIIHDKRDWWRHMTNKDGKNRGDIQDYDVLLGGRNEDEVLPDRCPIDDSIVMNYTGIDFSDKDKNINECKDNDGMDEVWSFASIDRIDSTKPYTYDNVEIISHYYNTQVKNCASVHQISKLNMYQIDRMVKSIHRNEVEFSKLSDVELVKYISLYESVLCTYDVILDKTSRYMDEYKRRNPEVFEENVI